MWYPHIKYKQLFLFQSRETFHDMKIKLKLTHGPRCDFVQKERRKGLAEQKAWKCENGKLLTVMEKVNIVCIISLKGSDVCATF